jgi:hypothetical protein
VLSRVFRVELDPQALAEMLEAAEYIARDSNLSADRWLEGLA